MTRRRPHAGPADDAPDVGAAPEVFHRGERAVQERVGVRGQMGPLGPKIIRDHIPDHSRSFWSSLPYALIGALDGEGWPWASLLTGPPGFITSPDRQTLTLDAQLAPEDPLAGDLVAGADVALLGIELATRRRQRVNGVVLTRDLQHISVGVKQSFGNCPQYIHPRALTGAVTTGNRGTAMHEGSRLSLRAEALVARADTLFIASATGGDRTRDRASGADVSHRGGPPGFVRLRHTTSGTELSFPDFRGNFMFNTLGNLAVYPRAGLLFIDFVSRDLLLLTGDAEIIWDGAELDAFAGAERLVRVLVRNGVGLPDALPFHFATAPLAAG